MVAHNSRVKSSKLSFLVIILFFCLVALTFTDASLFAKTKYVTIKYHTQSKTVKKKVKVNTKLYKYKSPIEKGYSFVAYRMAGTKKYSKSTKCKKSASVYGVYKDNVSDGVLKIKALKTAKAINILKYYGYKLSGSNGSFGYYVTGIDEKKERNVDANSGYYWMFYDNDKECQASVSKQTIKKGHYLTAKYRKISW